jgi:putative ubiquitin-RnfH superfamily antitoxin RatB of RatAB toxin-antitoxin module
MLAARAVKKTRITVEVVYATPETQAVEVVTLAVGATVAQAIAASGLLARFPEIDLSQQAVGVFGTRVSANDCIGDGDRVEIYRPLSADPKETRRRRARRSRATRLSSAGSGRR